MAYQFSSFDDKAQKIVDHVLKDVATLRTGRASVQLLDPVLVEAYGTKLRLVEVASVQAPDASQLLVSPWDKSLLGAVEKAIQAAGLNLTPVVDGESIRIVIPQLTQETRQQMVKSLHAKVESGRALLRSLRTDTKKEIEAQKGAGGVSEDDITAEEAQLEDRCKKILEEFDAVVTKKQAELMTV